MVRGLGPLQRRRRCSAGFRYCRICHVLNTVSLGVQGGCVNGAGHDNHPDFEYFLPWKSEGQGGWKVCGKCQGRYRQTGADAPFCLGAGMHLPQKNNANWQELRVMISGAGEAGWRRCDTCTGLFWTKKWQLGQVRQQRSASCRPRRVLRR